MGVVNKECNGIQNVKGGLKLTNSMTALKACSSSRGKNGLYIYKYKNNRYEEFIKAENYSFIYSIGGLALISKEDNKKSNKILLCACKKYFKNQKNGILIVNIEINNIMNTINKINYKFYDTKDFEAYCFCPLLKVNFNNINLFNYSCNYEENTNYVLVGGYVKSKIKGMIKLCKINYDKIEYIENIVIDRNINDNFKCFKGPISCIVQDNSNLIITCWDGKVRQFSLNIDWYLNYDEQCKNNISFTKFFQKTK